MIKIIKARWGIKEPIFEFVCSLVDDIANLPNLIDEEPFRSKGIGAGSTCICTENASVYMKSADDNWYLIEQKMGADFKNKVVKPGATEIAGTWQFNDTLEGGGWWSFDFTLNGTNGKGISYDDNRLVWEYDYDGDNVMDGDECLYESGWMGGAPTLTTSATVDSVEKGDTLLEWLNANATKIAEPEGGNDEGGNDEGGSSDVLAGTWSFNGELLFDKRYAFDIEFKAGGLDALYTEIVGEYNGEAHTLTYNGPDDVCYAYIDLGGGWSGPNQIEILIPYESAVRADELLAFLNKYATKIS